MKRSLIAGLAAVAVVLAPVSTAAPGGDLAAGPEDWPAADTAGFTSSDDPGWVFFRAYNASGQGCGIGPDGTVGCDIVVQRNDDGSAYTSIPGPPGSYACSVPGQPRRCPLPPPGANQVVAGPDTPARYVESDTLTFTRNVDVLESGYRLVNGGAECYVSAASPGGINCRSGDNGFLWSSWGGFLEPAS